MVCESTLTFNPDSRRPRNIADTDAHQRGVRPIDGVDRVVATDKTRHEAVPQFQMITYRVSL